MKMSEIGKRLSTAAAASVMFAAPMHAAMAAGGVAMGVLECSSVRGSGTNWVLHSSVAVNCKFSSPYGEERYRGETGIGFGVDLSYIQDRWMAFTVIGGASDVTAGAHALSGKYFGGKAGATVGVGGGAAVLLGGGSKNISLQPLAVEGNTGVGASGGLAYLFLEPRKY